MWIALLSYRLMRLSIASVLGFNPRLIFTRKVEAEVMENKYKKSLQINEVVKESSLDCIQHTLDDPSLNDKCIRFSDKLTGEIAYFPGSGARVLEQIDIVQLKSKFIYHIQPDIYVISAKTQIK